jgi:hypothetical protein
MRIFSALALFGLLWACGCRSGKHYVRGHGDAGQFILRQAVAYGGRPVTTNGLPRIEGDWRYIQDEYGVGLLLSKSQYQQVQDFVSAAFGPPSNSAGWAARDFGVAIMILKADSHTMVGIHPPMSYEKMGQGIDEMLREMKKGQ